MSEKIKGTKESKEKKVPEKKKKIVEEIINLINSYNTVMISLIENLSSAQLQKLKKLLTGKALIRVVKKNLILMALERAKERKKGIEALEKSLLRNFAMIFSNDDPFELAAILSENKTKGLAKSGHIAKEDIIVEAGPTDLMAGPIISELTKAKIKASIESGKIVIRERNVIVKKGEQVRKDVAGILAKLEIMPVVIYLRPVIAYDSKNQKVYENIKVDKEETLSDVITLSKQSFNFALNLEYISKETIKFLLIKANSQTNTLQNKVKIEPEQKSEVKEGKQEEKTEEKKKEKLDPQRQDKNKEQNQNINTEENKK